mgnify:CR=1 FL=1
MQWIVQNNLYKEVAFYDFINALNSFGSKYDIVNVIPFSHEFSNEPIITEKIVVPMGATTMIGIGQEKGWEVFYNDNFAHTAWLENLGSNLLNSEAQVCKFKEINPTYNPFFIRPSEDRKIFSGQVIDKANFDIWLRETTALMQYAGYVTLTPDTEVIVSPLKAIHSEWRFFVVDGEIVTGSLYKRGDRVISLPLIKNEDAEVFAKEMVALWKPAKAFVIDVALTDKGYRVIEYNCLNSSGFYASDLNKLVGAIEQLFA